MSRTGREWAFAVKGLAARYGVKVVLWYLGDIHSQREGIAFPSIATMATDLEMPERTVKHSIKVLEDLKLITTLQKGNQHQRTEYKLHFDNLHAVTEVKVQNPAQGQVQNQAESRGKILQVNVQKPASEGAKSRTPIKERTGKNREGTEKETGIKKKRLPRITVVNDAFREKMRERFGPTLDEVDERIDEALGHVASQKYTDLQAYVTGWLRRDAKASKNGAKPTARQGKTTEERLEGYRQAAAREQANR